jgi:hypothetical protein
VAVWSCEAPCFRFTFQTSSFRFDARLAFGSIAWLDRIMPARDRPATTDEEDQRQDEHEQSDRTNDQSQQLHEKRHIWSSHRLWPLSDEVGQIMQRLPERTENRSDCQ